MERDVDAIVIGSGPNGLVAAATLAKAGWSVGVVEQAEVAGGGIRSSQITAPGYTHDLFSAFYGLLHASPVFAELDLGRRLDWAHFDVPVAAALGPHEVALMLADADATATHLGEDGPAWADLCRWWERVGTRFLATGLAPIPSLAPMLSLAAHARARGMLDLAKTLLSPIDAVAVDHFEQARTRALLACGASHADLPVDAAGSTPAALILAMVSQQIGMPVPVGGASRLADALVRSVTEAGGWVRTNCAVTRIVVERGVAVGVESADGPIRARRAVVADTDAGRLARDLVGEGHLPASYLARLRRRRRGTGVFKVDVALDGPVPWADPRLGVAGVVHLTGDLDAMAMAAHAARHGELPDEPMLVVGQQTVADPSRAPAGGHTVWIETQVPSNPRGGAWPSLADRFQDQVLGRLEHHAPGFESRIVAIAIHAPTDLEAVNPNLVGGDIGGGSTALDQQLVFRPVTGWFRYKTPIGRLYLCSASAHPGGGVHGMGGRNCATRILRDARLRRPFTGSARSSRRGRDDGVGR